MTTPTSQRLPVPGRLFTHLAAAILALAGCAKSAPPPAALPPLPVTVRVAQPTRLPIALEAVAQTEGVREVEVRARVAGILEKRLYPEGEAVRAGQPLFQIERAPFEIALAQARAQLAEQQARATQAAREEARLKALLEQRAISSKEYDDATSSLAVTRAGVLAAEAAVRDAERNLSYATVTAPVAGMSGRAQVFEGGLVSASNASLLTTIVQLDPIRVRFSLAEGDLARLPGGPKGVRKVEMVLPDGSVLKQAGKLDFAASRIDPALGTLELRAEFPNPGGTILPGQFVRIRLISGEREQIFLMPQAAVQNSSHGQTVMLLGADGQAHPQPVTVAEWHGAEWIVTSGLKAGDKVIVDNLIKLMPGMAVSENPPSSGDQPRP